MDREAARSKAKQALRRGIGKVDALDRLVTRRDERNRRTRRLLAFYDHARERFTAVPAPGESTGKPALPAKADVAAVERAVLDSATTAHFIRELTETAHLEAPFVALVRGLLDTGDILRARSIAQVLQHQDGMRPLGDVCLAIVIMREPLFETSWELFCRNDLGFVLGLAPREYFEVGFEIAPDTAAAALGRVLDGELFMPLSPQHWLDVARWAFAVGAEGVSAGAAQVAERTGAGDRRLRRQIDALRGWYGRRDAAAQHGGLPAGEVALAVLDYARAGLERAGAHPDEALNTLTMLGNVVRHRSVRFTGREDLAGLADTLRSAVAGRRAIDGEDATVHLYAVDRDATSYCAVPDGTWLLASGSFLEPVFGLRRDLPLNPRLRPIFVGFETTADVLHGPGVVDYLRRYAPIGCRDWRTVFLLQGAGIPAFFSGWVTATADVFDAAPAPAADDGAGLAGEVLAALDRLRGAQPGPGAVTDSTARYLAARSTGAEVEFRPKFPGDGALEGLAGSSDAEFDAMRQSLLDTLAAAVSAIVAGRPEDEVYAAWREACAPAVAAAEARRASLPDMPPPSFDVAAAVRQTLAAAVVIERTAPAPDGAEINIELSLDGNYKHQLDVVLDSIVVHASRPIRAFVLCRDHDRSDFDRMARLFPTVSFVWLPTDNADYGPVAHMLGHITVATMDRLLLPDLLPDVDRIIHHDLDALCLADLAELWDLPMGDAPLAARDQRHPFRGSGYISMTGGLKRAKSIEKSQELMLRFTTRHPFDYRNFNAGVMVLNLARMRADGFTRRFLPYVERFGFNDQGVLNMYAGTERVDFARAWNAYPRFELVDDARILHWIGAFKPWQPAFIEGQQHWRAAEARFAERERGAALRGA